MICGSVSESFTKDSNSFDSLTSFSVVRIWNIGNSRDHLGFLLFFSSIARITLKAGRPAFIKIRVWQLLIGKTANISSSLGKIYPEKHKTVPITSAFSLQVWPPHKGNKLTCKPNTCNSKTLGDVELQTWLTPSKLWVVNVAVSPVRFYLLLFIQYTWIHSWLQNFLFRKLHLFWLEFSVLGIETAAVVHPLDTQMMLRLTLSE